VAASNGVARCVIPNGTMIPNRGHYLCVNSVGYSLSSYPAGNGTTASGNATYTTDIPDNAGIAIFNTSVAGNFTLANRMDAVGSTSEANTLYKEGSGYPALTPFSINYAFVRDECGKGGSITTFFWCTIDGPKDSNNNSADFVFVDTNGTSAGAGQRFGSPGPQNLSSPIAHPTGYLVNPLDACVGSASPPNRVRDFTSDPGGNATFGTTDIRLKITNQSGAPATRLRLRIVDLSTFPTPAGIADLRPRNSESLLVTVNNAPCASGSSFVGVQGTTVEQPPAQPSGAGFNSTLSVGTVTPANPLANNASVNVRIVMGFEKTGSFKLGVVIETLPGAGGKMHFLQGTEGGGVSRLFSDRSFDFDGDARSDVAIFRPSNGQWWIRNSTGGAVTAATFGTSTDKPMPGDYTGDRKSDIAFFRPSTGQWFVLRSEDSTFYGFPFGLPTDIPVPGDFDGDGRVDVSVFRPSTAIWYISRSSDGVTYAVGWGNSTDKPVPSDYDGDGKTDVAIFRPTGGSGSGEWWVSYSGGGYISTAFGSSTDKAVPGDYTGDGRADIAFWRPSNGQWFVLRSEDFSFYSAPLGVSTDIPVPGNYDFTQRFARAVFRPSTATWFIDTSDAGTLILNFGLPTDQPLENTYVR
jgi:hypothetical protein